ncbi:MAG: MFS transporter [Phycisphaera sp.]|nr:MFS transporter [Phycisphaera sp.]
MSDANESSAAPNRPRPIWRNVNFQLTWSSVAASGFGDRMIEMAALPMLGVLAAGASASAIGAAIYFWFFLPYVLISPIGGWLADTVPRKWLMLACDEGRALLLLLAWWMIPPDLMAAAIPQTDAWKVYAILFGVGCCAAVFSPTRNALIPQIVPPQQLNPANAMIVGIGVIASMIGQVVGGKLLEMVSLRTAVMVGLSCYFVTGTFWAFIRPKPHVGLETDMTLSTWVRLSRAIRYIQIHRPVFRLVLLNAVIWSVAMVVSQAVGALCKVSYLVPPDRYLSSFANISAMLGLGMLLGAGFVAWSNMRREVDVMLLVMIALTGVGMALLAAIPIYAFGMAMALLIGFAGGSVMILVTTMTQAIVPNFVLGRVSGVREVFSNIVAVLVLLMIWQMPAVQRSVPGLPDSDTILIYSLYPLAVSMFGIVVYALWRHTTPRPGRDRLVNFFWRLDRALVFVWHRLEVIGKENIPADGPVLLCANHTTGLDPFLMQAATPRTVRWLMLTEYQFWFAKPLWNAIKPIALEKDGSDMGKIRAIIRALQERDIVGLFPEGALQREHRDLKEFQQGVGVIAKRGKAVIVPVWIDGTPRKHHMLWHFLTPSRSTVRFGRPLPTTPDENPEEIVERLRKAMLELSKVQPIEE